MSDYRIHTSKCQGCTERCTDDDWGDPVCSDREYYEMYRKNAYCDTAMKLGRRILVMNCQEKAVDPKRDECKACGYSFDYP